VVRRTGKNIIYTTEELAKNQVLDVVGTTCHCVHLVYVGHGSHQIPLGKPSPKLKLRERNSLLFCTQET
jgi:hypothetical protein